MKRQCVLRGRRDSFLDSVDSDYSPEGEQQRPAQQHPSPAGASRRGTWCTVAHVCRDEDWACNGRSRAKPLAEAGGRQASARSSSYADRQWGCDDLVSSDSADEGQDSDDDGAADDGYRRYSYSSSHRSRHDEDDNDDDQRFLPFGQPMSHGYWQELPETIDAHNSRAVRELSARAVVSRSSTTTSVPGKPPA